MGPASDAGTVLVVGGDGLVGRALTARLTAAGRRVVSTTRRAAAHDPRFLDLSDVAAWRPPEGVSLAFLCAAAARLEACRRDPEGSARVNVTGTLAVARALSAAGAFVVGFSSDRVFDGAHPRRRAEESPCPSSEYGRQKAALEEGLTRLTRAAVIRLTKVLGADDALFAGWAAKLRAGSAVEAFKDATLSPIPAAVVAEAAVRAGGLSAGGLYQLSGADDTAYTEAARALARQLGADPSLVAPIACAERGHAAFPAFTSLDCSRASDELGFRPQPLEEVLALFR
ncbi:MAG: hypothetical protein A2506_10575 [Elusimicrobia bacterium RIFOXYD12_FULL_66_9]|nr:MAG: hypothetical protein A2506_10575 [Elusimicrobia bacterium RIFOXYD12_FULL_66_9]